MCPEIGSIADGVGQWEERADRDVAEAAAGSSEARAAVGGADAALAALESA